MTLINQDYQEQIQAMHAGGKFDNGAKQLRLVEPFIRQHQPRTVLDFGCGKGALIREIKIHYPEVLCWGYDPGNAMYSVMPPRRFDAVISTDAIEHIEPEHLADNLALIGSKIERVGFFRIACYPAKKNLPDGRNAHLIVQPPDWWREQIVRHMQITITHETVSVVDKTDKWHWVKGHNYDLTVEKT